MHNALGIAYMMNKELKPTALTSGSAGFKKKVPLLYNTWAREIIIMLFPPA